MLVETLKSALYYKTAKLVEIRNWKLGIVHYAIILVIIAYIGVWVIWLKSGYQAQYSLVGSASIKVKGNGFSNSTNDYNRTIWDAYDVVVPPVELDAVF